jgi:hypothetical protein
MTQEYLKMAFVVVDFEIFWFSWIHCLYLVQVHFRSFCVALIAILVGFVNVKVSFSGLFCHSEFFHSDGGSRKIVFIFSFFDKCLDFMFFL